MRCTECKDFFCKHRSQSTTGGECFYESKEQMEKLLAITTEATLDYVDWSAFRREAAKDAMCQLIGMGRDDGYKYSPKEVACYAIIYADELVKQLREDKK